MSLLNISLAIISILTIIALPFIDRKSSKLSKCLWYACFSIHLVVNIFFLVNRYQTSQTILNLEEKVTTLSLTAPKLDIDGSIIARTAVANIRYPSEFSDGIMRTGALFNEGNFDEAYQIAETLSKKKDDFGPAFFIMGTVEIEKGNYLKGEKQIHKALKLGLPKDQETAAYNNLFTAANNLFSEGKLDEAYQIAESLSQKKVDCGPAFFVMGSVENEKGNYLKAEEQIHKAIKLGLSKYNEASAYHNLAIAALRQNKKDDAILMLKQSLKSDTGFKESKILLDQLTRLSNQ